MRPPATDMVLRNDFNRFYKRTMSQVPELDLSRKEYAVQLKVDEETEGYDKDVAESHCKKFIEDAFKRNRKRMDFYMSNKGFYKFSCYLSKYQFRVLKGKSEVKSIVPIPRRVLEYECD